MRSKRRVGAAALAVVLVAGGAAAGVVVWRSLHRQETAYRVALSAVAATSTNTWTPGEEACPQGRGDGPARQESAVGPQATSSSGPVGAGQLLVYELLVQAGAKAPEQADLITSLAFQQRASTPGFDDAGVVCAFVDTANPQTTSTGATAAPSATTADTSSLIGGTDQDEDLRSDIHVSGLERGATAVVDVWIRAAEEASQGSDALVSRVVGVTAPAGATADLTAGSARILRASRPGRTQVQVTLSAAAGSAAKGGTLAAGGPITYTLVLRNAAQTEVANEAVVRFDPDPATTVESIEVHDTVGRSTACHRDGGSVICTAPYLLPGEAVTMTFDGQVASDAPTALTGAGSKCAAQAQDLCAHATVLSVAGISGQLAGVDLATDVPAPQALGLTKRVGDGQAPLYAGRFVEFTYTLVASSATPVSAVTVTDPACPQVVQVSGDVNSDTVLSPGEQWVYHCSAVVDASQKAEVSVLAKGPAGEDVKAVGRMAVPVLSPALVLQPKDDVQGGPQVELVNTGDAPLGSIVVAGRGCDMGSAQGDIDRNGSLDPGERWTMDCRQRTGPVRAYATDPAGGAVTAASGG